MEITQIKKGRSVKYHIYVDGQYSLTLHEQVVLSVGLLKGPVTPEQLAELKMRSEQKMALDKALALLSVKDRTENGLFETLCEKFEPEAAAFAVARVKELGLVDDERYAHRLARDLYSIKCFAKRRVQQELIKRGIAKELAESCAEQNEIDPLEALEGCIARKSINFADKKEVLKLKNVLRAQGFGFSDIDAAFRSLEESGEREEQSFNLAEYVAKKHARNLGDRAGREKIKSALLRQGYGYAEIKEALDQIAEEDESTPQEEISELLQGKYARFLNNEKGIEKTAAALARAGYRLSDIKEAMALHFESEK